MQRLGRVFRAVDSDILREPVPNRWVELIHRLNELERQQSHADKMARDRADRKTSDPS